jgi:hypothetical protein
MSGTKQLCPADKVRSKLFDYGWRYLDSRNLHVGKSWRTSRAIERISKEGPMLSRTLPTLKHRLIAILNGED